MSNRSRAAAVLMSVLVLSACGQEGTDGNDDGADGASAAGTTSAVAGSGGDGTDGGSGDGSGGGSGDAADSDGTSGALGDCAPASGRIVDVAAQPGEPQVQIPQPDGWERNDQLDSELIRLALVNPALGTPEFSPNVVVTGEPATADADAVFEGQMAGIREGMGAGELDPVPTTVCGLEAMKVDYTAPAMGAAPERPATVLILLVPTETGAVSYTITAQSTDAADETYQRDVQTILEGVQIRDDAA